MGGLLKMSPLYHIAKSKTVQKVAKSAVKTTPVYQGMEQLKQLK